MDPLGRGRAQVGGTRRRRRGGAGPGHAESHRRIMSNTSDVPRLTSKGQVTVPVAIRYALDLAPGDDVVFAIEDGHGVFRRATALDGLRRSFAVEPRAGAHALERM